MCLAMVSRRNAPWMLTAAMVLLAAGCEGIDRKHDARVGDVSPPPDDMIVSSSMARPETPNIPDLVEDMHATRQTYIQKLIGLERAFLLTGDSVRADWARRQKDLTESVVVYPYLATTAPEQRVEVAPIESIPEADAIYARAKKILDEVRAIPLAGALTYNKNKAREALALFKQILRQYPKSDKVDDCAYYCGEIYKEYLREDDPDDELAIRYYRWAVALDPKTPHAARFQCAVVYDFRRHNRAKALELYQQVLDLEENGNQSNMRFSATRIEQLSDEEFSHLRPEPGVKRPVAPEPKSASEVREPPPAEPLPMEPGADEEALEPQARP